VAAKSKSRYRQGAAKSKNEDEPKIKDAGGTVEINQAKTEDRGEVIDFGQHKRDQTPEQESVGQPNQWPPLYDVCLTQHFPKEDPAATSERGFPSGRFGVGLKNAKYDTPEALGKKCEGNRYQSKDNDFESYSTIHPAKLWARHFSLVN
jgi:hypothetical protein